MVRPIALSCLAVVGLYGFTGAVVAKPNNGSSLSPNNHHQNSISAATLVNSQSRVNQLNGLPPQDSKGSSSANQLLSKGNRIIRIMSTQHYIISDAVLVSIVDGSL